MKRLGILTGGGDCPGLNAAIRAVTRRSLDLGSEVVGIEDGWKGLVEGTTRELSRQRISGILPRGGTIIGTARTNPYKLDGGVDKVTANMTALGLDGLVAIGGEDTLGVATRLYRSMGFRSSACRRRSTTTSRRPTTRSASTRRSRSARRRSTDCTRRPSRTTASWSSR